MFSKKLIPVCRDLFLSTLLLSKNRVQGVVRRNFIFGTSPTENRGGNRKTNIFMDKRNGVITFIKKINVIESHYCRSKSSSRVYISSELNIKKLWRIYNDEAEDLLKVKESYFRHIFCTEFNIGFGTPSTDACSTCISLSEKIKHSDCSTKKNELKTELKLHKLKANAFYSKLKENKQDLLIVSFDCQKNQPLPRVPDQAAYYSRQLYKYNLTIIIGHSKCAYTKDNVFIYHWDETEHAKGSNEISSAVYHCLSNLVIPTSIKTVRLVADGCGGQNKNSTMMGMVSTWFLNLAPIHVQNVEFVFPIVGHSFLPADRVFANIEKKIKRKDVITSPDEYTNLFSDFGTTVPLAGIVHDWKTSVQSVFKPPGGWHFSFNSTKRFLFKKNVQKTNVLIKGEVSYQVETGAYKNVCKKGKTVHNINNLHLSEISTRNMKINPLKLRDVDNLLKKHYGDQWQTLDFLRFYKDNIFKKSQ
ncbi:uncharacterized protein LOC126552866 [Aphis gossypii]|uniref:uncharacterized protein LOC126552866 n=1 Tax=Aphis gossypii TaxID=80765 RepID=UPI002158FD71|nr:uncharacterized protein LOC126552866 [Aphis gossypii]